jgi:hypothetical protein
MKKYQVIYTDLGDSCDGRARTLGTFETYESARAEMEKDVAQYIESDKENGIHSEITADFCDLILVGDDERGCQWQIMDL